MAEKMISQYGEERSGGAAAADVEGDESDREEGGVCSRVWRAVRGIFRRSNK